MRNAILMAMFLSALEGCGYQGGYVLEADGGLPDAGARPPLSCAGTARAMCPAGWAPGCVDPATGFIARNPPDDPDGPGVCTAHGFLATLYCGDAGVIDVCGPPPGVSICQPGVDAGPCVPQLVPGCAALYDDCPAP